MKQFLFTTVLIYAFTSLSSCKKEQEIAIPQEKGPFITFMNACPGSGEVNAGLKSQTHHLNHKLNYLSITGYYAVTPGSYSINFTTFPIPKQLAAAQCTLEQDKYYLSMVIGKVGRARVLVTENSVGTPKAGRANVRFINACSDSCRVDLLLNGTTLFSEINYKDATSYTEIEAGVVTFATRKNTDGDNLTQNSFTLEGQKNYTFLLVGSKDGVDKEALDLKSIRY